MHKSLHLLVSELIKVVEPEDVLPSVHLGGNPVGWGSCEHVCPAM